MPRPLSAQAPISTIGRPSARSLPLPEIPGEPVPNDEGENTTGVPFHEEIDPEDVGMIKRDPGSEGRH
jgi:hypothetical protein